MRDSENTHHLVIVAVVCVDWGRQAYTTSTVCDISTFAVLCSVTRPYCRFTRVYEGRFMLCYKEEF